MRTRERAQMNATPPEARSKYSTLLLVALPACAVLAIAEFLRLYSVHLITSTSPTQTVSAGSHNAYALIPVALLAAVLAIGPARTGAPGAARAACIALIALGLLALGITLIGDLPDAHAHGLTRHYVLAATTTGPAIYFETLGAVLLLAAGGIGLLRAGGTDNARTAHYTGPGAAAGQPSQTQM
jgi:hypothetical protein